MDAEGSRDSELLLFMIITANNGAFSGIMQHFSEKLRHKSHSRQDGEKVARMKKKTVRVIRRHASYSQDGRGEKGSRQLFMSTFGHEENSSFPSTPTDYSRNTPSQVIAALKSSETHSTLLT